MRPAPSASDPRQPAPHSEPAGVRFAPARGHCFAACRSPYFATVHRIFTTSVADVYPHYVAKVEQMGRTKAGLDQVIEWLTGYDDEALGRCLASGTTFEAFFAGARMSPKAPSITGVVCGVRVEDIDDPLMQQIRYLDKLVDEVARG